MSSFSNLAGYKRPGFSLAVRLLAIVFSWASCGRKKWLLRMVCLGGELRKNSLTLSPLPGWASCLPAWLPGRVNSLQISSQLQGSQPCPSQHPPSQRAPCQPCRSPSTWTGEVEKHPAHTMETQATRRLFLSGLWELSCLFSCSQLHFPSLSEFLRQKLTKKVIFKITVVTFFHLKWSCFTFGCPLYCVGFENYYSHHHSLVWLLGQAPPPASPFIFPCVLF